MRETSESGPRNGESLSGRLQADFDAHAAVAGAHAHSPTLVTAERLVLIYSARLLRECLRRSLKAATPYEVDDYNSVDDWQACRQPKARPQLVLLGLLGHDSDDGTMDMALQRAGSTPVVVTSDREDPAYIVQVLSRGVRGFIPTSLALEVSIGALQVVKAGGIFAPAGSLLDAPRRSAAHEPNSANSSHFTAKQLAVIGAIRKGKANKTIAYELNMCESTVKVHVRNIMKKMHARNRTEVAFIASNTLGNDVP